MQMTIRKSNGAMCATSVVNIDGIRYTASTRLGPSTMENYLMDEGSGEVVHSVLTNIRSIQTQRIASFFHKLFVGQFNAVKQ